MYRERDRYIYIYIYTYIYIYMFNCITIMCNTLLARLRCALAFPALAYVSALCPRVDNLKARSFRCEGLNDE